MGIETVSASSQCIAFPNHSEYNTDYISIMGRFIITDETDSLHICPIYKPYLTTGSPYSQYSLDIYNAGAISYFFARFAIGGAYVFVGGAMGDELELGDECLAAGSFDGTNFSIYLYKNKDLFYTATKIVAAAVLATYDTPVEINKYSVGGPLYGSAIYSDSRIYNRAFPREAFDSIYFGQGNDGITKGMVLRALMNEDKEDEIATGAGKILDISTVGNNGQAFNSPVYKAYPLKVLKG